MYKPHIFQEFHEVNSLLGTRVKRLLLFKNPTYLELEAFDQLSLLELYSYSRMSVLEVLDLGTLNLDLIYKIYGGFLRFLEEFLDT